MEKTLNNVLKIHGWAQNLGSRFIVVVLYLNSTHLLGCNDFVGALIIRLNLYVSVPTDWAYNCQIFFLLCVPATLEMSWISSFFFICTLQTLRFPKYCIFLLTIFFSFCPSVSIVYYDQWWGFFYNCFVWLYSVPMCRFNCRPSINTTCRSIKQRSPFIPKYHAIDQLIGTYLVNKVKVIMFIQSAARIISLF